MALEDQILISAIWVNSDVRFNNTTGTVLDSAVSSGTGKEISDIYSLKVTVRSGGTATVTVTSTSKSNPYNGRVKTLVPFDGATVVTDVLPGADLVFNASAVNNDIAEVDLGNYGGSFDASGVDAGVPSSGLRHQVVNTGAEDVSSAVARLLTQSIQYEKTGKVFDTITPFAKDATEKIAGGGSFRVMPYAMSIDNVSGSGPTKVADLLIDGANFDTDQIQDLTTGMLNDGTGLKAVSPIYPYLIVDGPLKGMGFALSSACADSDVANVLIFNSRYVQIAEDTAGVEGTYGTDDVDLTETGQSTGVITASGHAYYWTRILVPSSASNESNPYPANVALQVTESQNAGWGV